MGNTNVQENITAVTNFMRNKRRECGLKQAFVAEKLSITQSQFSKKERGESPWSLEEIVILCELYELDTSYLFWKMSSHN